MLELVVRLVFSLAVVVGMLLLLARFSARRFRGSADALVRVVHRQPLSRSTSVAVVTVGSRVLVLGATEHQVQLLTELEPDELDLDDEPLDAALDEHLVPGPAPAPRRTVAGVARSRTAGRHARTADTALAGSVLSAQTWRQALAAATGKVQDAS